MSCLSALGIPRRVAGVGGRRLQKLRTLSGKQGHWEDVCPAVPQLLISEVDNNSDIQICYGRGLGNLGALH